MATEELESRDRPGMFGVIRGWFSRNEEYVDDEYPDEAAVRPASPSRLHRPAYVITVRRVVQSFQDAVAAADGLKKGDCQVLNLTACDASLREKIKDFMCGVNYSQEGTWEELGENVYLLAPSQAAVEVAPASPRMQAAKN